DVCCNGKLPPAALTLLPPRPFTPPVASTRPSPAAAPERALLLERAATALVHEGKNPLHNMVLHVQLLDEKVRDQGQGVAPFERHLQALRDGIGRVDSLLKAFSDLAAPWNLEPDLAAAVSRAQLLFGHEARRGSVEVVQRGPASVPVQAEAGMLCDLVCHAYLAGVALARDGTLRVSVDTDGPRARLELHAEGGAPRREE